MSRRRIASLSAFGLALAAVAILVGGPSRKSAVSPGPVAASHLAIAENCSACHEQGDGTALDWVQAAWAGHSPLSQNALCLECHDRVAADAANPHGLAPTALRRITERTTPRRKGALFARFVRNTVPLPSELACSACHQEHHGVDHDLEALADQQCQVCHQNTFGRFDAGHPDFTEYPFDRRPRIHFDHATHYGVHFANFQRLMPAGIPPGSKSEIAAASSASCRHCHELDAGGAFMAVRGYETMCASCHESQIGEDDPAVTPPIPVLALSTFGPDDDARVRAAAANQLPIPPIMLLLLSADQQVREAHAQSRTDAAADFGAMVADDQKRALMIEATDRLLVELAADPIQSVQNRLTAVIGDGQAADTLTASAQFRPSGFAAGLRELAVDLDRLRTSPTRPAEAANENATESPGATAHGQLVTRMSWTYDPATMTLSYTPHGHADPFVRAWVDLAAKCAAPEVLTPEENAGERNLSGAAVDGLLEYFARPTSAGRCVKCHTVDAVPGGRRHVNWQSRSAVSSRDGFTHFAHGPHIVMFSTGDDCQHCHTLEEDVRFFRPEFLSSGGLASPEALAPACGGVRQFASAEQCAACHRRGGASQRCTTCHNYHVAPGSHGYLP